MVDLARQLAGQTGVAENDVLVLFQYLRQHISLCPEDIEEIFPNYRLTKRRMTPKERAVVTLPLANQGRLAKQQAYVHKVMPVVKAVIRLNPKMTIQELADYLNTSGISPLRAKSWSIGSVRTFLDMMEPWSSSDGA